MESTVIFRTAWYNTVLLEPHEIGLTNAVQSLYNMASSPATIEKNDLNSAAKQAALEADKTVISARGNKLPMNWFRLYSGAALSGKPINVGLIHAAKAVADSVKAMLLAADSICADPQMAYTMREALNLSFGSNNAATKFLQAALKGNLADTVSQDLIVESGKELQAVSQAFVEVLNQAM